MPSVYAPRFPIVAVLAFLCAFAACRDCRECACNTCSWRYYLGADQARSVALSRPQDHLSACVERNGRFAAGVHTILGRVSTTSPAPAVDLEMSWAVDERSGRCAGIRSFSSADEALAASDLQAGVPICILDVVGAAAESCTLVDCGC